MTLLRYTGHPFVDVGVATLTAMSSKRSPTDVTIDDLERVAAEIKTHYTELRGMMRHLTTFFHSSGFVQPSFDSTRRKQYADEVLFGFREDTPILENYRCVFFPEKTAVMFASRQHIPLLNGKEVANFSAYGHKGIPVSGAALLAIHALPFGCLKCGNLLAFHQIHTLSDNEIDLTFLMSSWCYRQNRQVIQQMSVDENATMPSLGGFARTRYIEALLQVRQEVWRRRIVNLHNITGYYFSNFGNSAGVEIVRLDNNVADFISMAEQSQPDAWHYAVHQAWRLQKGETTNSLGEEAKQARRNDLYENLFELPQNARRVLLQLSVARSWQLISIFLHKGLLMEQKRIDTYRKLGDRLAEYIRQYEGEAMGFYYSFARARNYTALRQVLRRAAERVARDTQYTDPLFTYEEFILAFEHPSEGYSQWQLGRDLITFRLLELLKEKGEDLTALPVDESSEDELEAV